MAGTDWRLPMTMYLLPGFAWRRKLIVKRRVARGYVVEFNAQAGDDSWVYDCTVLTSDQLAAWTGQSEAPSHP